MTALLVIFSVYLQACDPDIFPNIHLLLRIACTIPVKSADNEHSNSTLKLVKGYLQWVFILKSLSITMFRNLPNNNLVESYSLIQCLRNLNKRDF